MSCLRIIGMSLALYPCLLAAQQDGSLQTDEVSNAIAACAEGYAFPTNLDRDPPLAGLAPPSQADIVRRALAEEWSLAQLQQALQDNQWRRQTV